MPAGMMNLKLDMDHPADRQKLRRAVLDLINRLCQSSDPTSVTIQHGGLKLCDKVLFQNLNQASVLILQSYFRRAGKFLQHHYPPLWAAIDDRVANV
jgi:hypothetical protein